MRCPPAGRSPRGSLLALGLALLGALVIALPRIAVGDPAPSRVVVLEAPSAPRLITDAALRLAGELRGAGLDASVLEGRPGEDPCDEANSNPAPVEGAPPPVATIFLTVARDGAAADVWVCDRITKKMVMRHMAAEDDAGALAIRASELLRASLIELAIDPKAELPSDVARWLGPLPSTVPALPSPDPKALPTAPSPPPASPPTTPHETPPGEEDAPAPPSLHQQAPAPTDAASLGGAIALLLSPGGFPPSFGPEIAFRYQWRIGLEIHARTAVTFAPMDLQDPTAPRTASVTLRHGVGSVSLEYRFGADDSALRPALGSGLGVYVVGVYGHGTANALGRTSVNASFVPTLDGDLEMRFHERVRGLLGVSALFPLPDPVILIRGTKAGRAGEPLILASLGVNIRL